MKKTFRICYAIILCVTFLIQPAFAAEINDLKSNKSIYATNAEQLNKLILENTGYLGKTLKNFNISIDLNSIMPTYKTSLYDFAKTGILDIEPMALEGGQLYVADTVDAGGNFAGYVTFTADGKDPNIHMYIPSTNQISAVDFRANIYRVHASLSQIDFDTRKFDAKLVFVDGLGFVYYINDGITEALINAGMKGIRDDIFTEETQGMLVIDDSFRQLANNELKAYMKELEFLATLPPGVNPPTGGNVSASAIDNAPHIVKTISQDFVGFILLLITAALMTSGIYLKKLIAK